MEQETNKRDAVSHHDTAMLDHNRRLTAAERLARHTRALRMGAQLRKAVLEKHERSGKPY